MFFSSQALYVLVWDMGVSNSETMVRRSSLNEVEQGEFALTYDSDGEDGGMFDDVELRRRIRAIEKDVDDKVNFWVHTIQSSAPGAAILPIASFDDSFPDQEAKLRCKVMKDRLIKKEALRLEGMEKR